ncbi:MAG: metallophosphoesterase [Lachnospiraceae bacterium]|nr:metallophosphoesterase [Lachnospiraceae bacterium]
MKKNAQFTWKRTAVLLSLSAILASGFGMTAMADDGFTAETLILTPADTTASLNLNWYCNANETGTSQAWFQTDGQSPIVVNAVKAGASVGKLSCKATVSGLSAGKVYRYWISNDNGETWSKEYTYQVPAEGAFSFAFVGDPQLNNGEQDKSSAQFSADRTTKQGWADTLSQIEQHDVDFIASAGDQVDTTKEGKETEYVDFTDPSQMQKYAFAASVGNHDRHTPFLYHYNLPNIVKADSKIAEITGSSQSQAAVETTGNYYYMVNNALFVVLNDSAYPQNTEQAVPFIQLFDQTLQAAVTAHPDYQWLFVQHHKSTESAAQHVADRDIQYYVEAGFEKLMDKYKVDVVLAGHDHVYVRSYAMYNSQRVSDDSSSLVNPQGTIYLTCNTGSGLKYYNIFDSEKIYVKDNDAYPYLANGMTGSQEYLKGVYPMGTNVAVQNKIPGYTIVTVDGGNVTMTTYSTYGQGPSTVLDKVTISK